MKKLTTLTIVLTVVVLALGSAAASAHDETHSRHYRASCRMAHSQQDFVRVQPARRDTTDGHDQRVVRTRGGCGHWYRFLPWHSCRSHGDYRGRRGHRGHSRGRHGCC
jgi:hypothetical protein